MNESCHIYQQVMPECVHSFLRISPSKSSINFWNVETSEIVWKGEEEGGLGYRRVLRYVHIYSNIIQ